MSLFKINCCFKLNSFICGTKRNIRKKSMNKREDLYSPKLCKERSFQMKSREDKKDRIMTEKRILHRSNENERYGLTLSYEYQSNNQLKIYIEKIDENSIADLHGNLQSGDEIIRINNRSFSNRDQAIQLIYQHSHVILQILPSKFVNRRYSPVESMITEDDSGILLACQTIDQNEKRSFSFPNLRSNQRKDRRCLSLNDLSKISFLSDQFQIWNGSRSSESFLTISTNNARGILKPLPLNQFTKKSNSRKDSKNDSFYIEKYSLRKLNRKRSFQSVEEDFDLLNRIFLRENQNELVKKPHLAMKYQQQSNIQKQLLKDSFQKSSSHHPFTTNSTRNNSIHTNTFHSSIIFI